MKVSTLIIIREMQIKTAENSHFTATRLAKINSTCVFFVCLFNLWTKTGEKRNPLLQPRTHCLV